MEEEISSERNEGLGGARLPRPSKPLLTSWENTERIASVNSYK